jgi:predicted nucleic acid-binding protein
MSGRTFLDTNVLVYLFDQDAPAKQAQARRILADEGAEGTLILSTQVLQEFYAAVTRKLTPPLPPEVAQRAVEHFSQLHVVPNDTRLVLEAIALSRKHAVSIWDALIVQAALRAGCTRLLTDDLHAGWEVLGLRVENPFEG